MAGAHLPRFYEDDLNGYGQEEHARWPISRKLLGGATTRRPRPAGNRLPAASARDGCRPGRSARLQRKNAHEPPWGVDVRSGTNTDISLGLRQRRQPALGSAGAGRCARQRATYPSGGCSWRRTRTFTGWRSDGDRSTVRAVEWLRHQLTRRPSRRCAPRRHELTRFRSVVLAASTIESTRLALLSGLGDPPSTSRSPNRSSVITWPSTSSCAGRCIRPTMSGDPHDQFINVVVPPRQPGGGQSLPHSRRRRAETQPGHASR